MSGNSASLVRHFANSAGWGRFLLGIGPEKVYRTIKLDLLRANLCFAPADFNARRLQDLICAGCVAGWQGMMQAKQI